MDPSKNEKAANQPDKLHRRRLPFYMQLPILVTFIVVSVVGQIAWTAAVHLSRVDTSWCGVGFAAGIVLGFIQGKWTGRMWERDYMRVLEREITFWDARGAKGTTIFVVLALGMPILFGLLVRQTYGILAGLQSYVFGFVGGMNLALVLWVRRLPR